MRTIVLPQFSMASGDLCEVLVLRICLNKDGEVVEMGMLGVPGRELEGAMVAYRLGTETGGVLGANAKKIAKQLKGKAGAG